MKRKKRRTVHVQLIQLCIHVLVQITAGQKLRAHDVEEPDGLEVKTDGEVARVELARLAVRLVEHVLVLRRTGNEVPWTSGRDKWWHEEIAKVPRYCPPEIMSAEDPLFILYVSISITSIWVCA